MEIIELFSGKHKAEQHFGSARVALLMCTSVCEQHIPA